MDPVEEIYNKVYGEAIYEKPNGVIPFLYHILKKYEINRYIACIDLLPTGKDRLLDVGCGGGGHLIYELGELFAECYGIDVPSVIIDHGGCISCGLCWTNCPEIFEENP